MEQNLCEVNPGLPDLDDASFKGVPFYTSKEEGEYARRIVTNEYPNRDDPYFEDLGLRYAEFQVQGYLYGPTVTDDMAALRAACLSTGAGTLVLPTMTGSVVCLTFKFSRSLERLDWYEVMMTFRKSGTTSAQAQTTVATPTPQQIDQSYSALTVAQNNAFLGQFNTNTTSTNLLNAATRIEAFAATVTAAIASSLVASRLLANSPSGTVAALLDPSTSLVTSTSSLDYPTRSAIAEQQFQIEFMTSAGSDAANAAQVLFTYSQDLANGNSDGSARADVIPAVGTILSSLQQAFDLQDQITTYTALASFSSVAPPSSVRCQSDLDDLLNEHAFSTAVRNLALACLGKAIAQYPYGDRQSAVQARADYAELCDNQLQSLQQQVSYTTWAWPETVSGSTETITYGGVTPTATTTLVDFNDYASAEALQDARDTAIKIISNTVASLDQIVFIDSSSSLPAIFWAYRINGDPEDALDLMSRNYDAEDGNFMPLSFQIEIPPQPSTASTPPSYGI